jgi:hypothetical protein
MGHTGCLPWCAFLHATDHFGCSPCSVFFFVMGFFGYHVCEFIRSHARPRNLLLEGSLWDLTVNELQSMPKHLLPELLFEELKSWLVHGVEWKIPL